jgi:hypothetical protein
MPSEPTPVERIFRSLYVGLSEKWNSQKYRELAIKLNWTEVELGAYVGLTPAETIRYVGKNKFPLPVCRHLNMIDRFVDEKRGKKPEPDPWEDYVNECGLL